MDSYFVKIIGWPSTKEKIFFFNCDYENKLCQIDFDYKNCFTLQKNINMKSIV